MDKYSIKLSIFNFPFSIDYNLTTWILILRMLLLLDDAKHQRNQSHTPHKHQQCHQQLAVVSQPWGKVQTGPHRAQCRHTLEGNGQKRRPRLQNADDENKQQQDAERHHHRGIGTTDGIV